MVQGHSPTDPPSGAASKAEGVENASDEYGLFAAYGESHLPSVAPQLGFVRQQRSCSVLTVLSNCYFSPLSALQKQSTAGVNGFYSPHIINHQLSLRSRPPIKYRPLILGN